MFFLYPGKSTTVEPVSKSFILTTHLLCWLLLSPYPNSHTPTSIPTPILGLSALYTTTALLQAQLL